MWAHPGWVGEYLSPGNRGRELAEYARWCNAVEGNTTFYAEPSASTVRRWSEQAPPEFRFAFKLPRTITHERRLRGVDAEVVSFLRRIEPLGDRVGPLQIQLPPSFSLEHAASFRSFVAALPSGHDWTVEFRHTSWFGDGAARRATDEFLDEHDVGRIVLDTRPLHASPPRTDAAVDERRTKPKLPIALDHVGTNPIVRLIGADDLATTRAGLQAWFPQIVRWLEVGRLPSLFVHQPENLHSPALAREVHAAVRALLPAVEPLPEPLPVADAGEIVGQDRLF